MAYQLKREELKQLDNIDRSEILRINKLIKELRADLKLSWEDVQLKRYRAGVNETIKEYQDRIKLIEKQRRDYAEQVRLLSPRN